MTLDELTALLRLPEGHSLHAVDELPPGYCPGLALTIVSDDDARGPLPAYKATEALFTVDLDGYRRLVSNNGVVKSRLRSVEEPGRLVPRHDDHQTEIPAPYEYAPPVKTPVSPHPVTHGQGGDIKLTIPPPDTREWPKFPGEGLDYRGLGDDPGDEDIHTGGPR